MKRGEWQISIDGLGVSRVRAGSLERRMRERWSIISGFWEENKQPHNKLDLLANLDHYGKLSAQLKWRNDPGERPVRVLYGSAGTPTASLLQENDAMVDETLYWITCKDNLEAHYLIAIINSDALTQAVADLMPKGQFGARHLHKHLWKLPIPEFDADDPLHAEISDAGRAAAAGAAQRLAELRAQRGDNVSVTIARRELRAWLRTSPQGTTAESSVTRLLARLPPGGGRMQLPIVANNSGRRR